MRWVFILFQINFWLLTRTQNFLFDLFFNYFRSLNDCGWNLLSVNLSLLLLLFILVRSDFLTLLLNCSFFILLFNDLSNQWFLNWSWNRNLCFSFFRFIEFPLNCFWRLDFLRLIICKRWFYFFNWLNWLRRFLSLNWLFNCFINFINWFFNCVSLDNWSLRLIF